MPVMVTWLGATPPAIATEEISDDCTDGCAVAVTENSNFSCTLAATVVGAVLAGNGTHAPACMENPVRQDAHTVADEQV